eukprot:6378845-Prymnesium_polylepis.1
MESVQYDSQTTMSITEFKCFTDKDLYLTSVADPSIVLLATSTATEVENALSSSSQTFPQGLNFASGTTKDLQVVPNALFTLVGNIKLVCGDQTLFAMPIHQPPSTFPQHDGQLPHML